MMPDASMVEQYLPHSPKTWGDPHRAGAAGSR